MIVLLYTDASISLIINTSGYATWFTAGGCNPHRSLWRHWWRHNSETIRAREKRRPHRPMKSSELSNGENRIALRHLFAKPEITSFMTS